MTTQTILMILGSMTFVLGVLLILSAAVLGRVVKNAADRIETTRKDQAFLVEMEGRINALASEHDRFQKREDQRWRRDQKAAEIKAAAPGTPGGPHIHGVETPGGDKAWLFER